MNRRSRTAFYSLGILICVGTSLSFAQPSDTDPEARAPAAEHRPDAQSDDPHRKNPRGQPKRVVDIRINPDALRSRLTRSISRTEKMLASHKSALEKLDAGASAQEVLEAMRLDNAGRGLNPEQRPAPTRRAGEQNKPSTDLNPKEREELHQFINEHFSDLSRNLELLTTADPHGADRILTQLAPQIREVLMLQATEPDLARIKIHDMQAGLNFIEASRNYRMTSNNENANESQQADALAQLHDAAAQRFDAQLNAKQFEISKLEARLDELKSAVDHLESKRSEEIDRMIVIAKRNAVRHQMKSKQRRNQPNND
ncbi:MAG: hypothetical protein P1U42_01770 [Phycisphaerales bacterium]|nr:hypothetical protein [Phycisphaerales bacterium]